MTSAVRGDCNGGLFQPYVVRNHGAFANGSGFDLLFILALHMLNNGLLF